MPNCYGSIVWNGARLLAAFVLSLSLGLGEAEAGKRVALVVGNSAYAHLARLNNPHRDAEAIADLLKSLGWDVIKGIDLTFVQFHDAVAELEGKANGAELAMVYYAGHGMSHQNRDFVAPTDMPEHCANDALLRVIPLERFFQAVEGAQRKVVLLDACRNQPFPNCSKRGVEGSFRGLSRVQSSSLLILSATSPGGVAQDGAPGAHSPFARVLLDSFRVHPDVFMHELLFKVMKDVSRETKQSQTPEIVVRGAPPEICLAAGSCSSLASLSVDDVKLRKQADAARRQALEEAELLRKRLKQDEEKAKQKARRDEEEAALLRWRLKQDEEKAKQKAKRDEEEAESLRRRLKEEEDKANRKATALKEREQELRELEERLDKKQRVVVAPPLPPPVAPSPRSCGWYAIAFCSQSYAAAQVKTGTYSGYVIDTNDTSKYPNFRAGWYCVVQGPMGRDQALSVARRMNALGAGSAYAKSSC